jgi:hypothetical protein
MSLRVENYSLSKGGPTETKLRWRSRRGPILSAIDKASAEIVVSMVFQQTLQK